MRLPRPASRFSSLDAVQEALREEAPVEDLDASASAAMEEDFDDVQLPLEASNSWDVSGGGASRSPDHGRPVPARTGGAARAQPAIAKAATAKAAPAAKASAPTSRPTSAPVDSVRSNLASALGLEESDDGGGGGADGSGGASNSWD